MDVGRAESKEAAEVREEGGEEAEKEGTKERSSLIREITAALQSAHLKLPVTDPRVVFQRVTVVEQEFTHWSDVWPYSLPAGSMRCTPSGRGRQSVKIYCDSTNAQNTFVRMALSPRASGVLLRVRYPHQLRTDMESFRKLCIAAMAASAKTTDPLRIPAEILKKIQMIATWLRSPIFKAYKLPGGVCENHVLLLGEGMTSILQRMHRTLCAASTVETDAASDANECIRLIEQMAIVACLDDSGRVPFLFLDSPISLNADIVRL
jgi:hypothetical protein